MTLFSLALPRPPYRLAALRAGADPDRADRLGSPREGRHAVDWRCCSRCRAAMHRTGVERNRNSCVCVKGDDRGSGGGKGRVRDQKGELSIGCGHQLEPTKDFGGHGVGRTEFSSTADGQSGWELHVEGLSQVRLLGRGLLRIVHGHHLAHAAGQVVEEPRPHLRVHPLWGGQEAGDLVHALVESSSVFAQDGGICWERCWEKERWRISVTHRWIYYFFNSSWRYDVFDLFIWLDKLTAHLHALQVPQVLHCHFQDICFLQLGVSGALQDITGKVEFAFETHCKRNYLRTLKELLKASKWFKLTSFLSASRMRVLSCPRLSFILALRRFSMIGLDDCKKQTVLDKHLVHRAHASNRTLHVMSHKYITNLFTALQTLYERQWKRSHMRTQNICLWK